MVAVFFSDSREAPFLTWAEFSPLILVPTKDRKYSAGKEYGIHNLPSNGSQKYENIEVVLKITFWHVLVPGSHDASDRLSIEPLGSHDQFLCTTPQYTHIQTQRSQQSSDRPYRVGLILKYFGEKCPGTLHQKQGTAYHCQFLPRRAHASWLANPLC